MMKDTLAHHSKDWLSLALAGLGISFAPHVWIGGMLLALAGAAVAMRSDPEKDNRELWLILLTAFLVAHVAAIIVHWMWESFPPQLVMFGAGFLSRWIIRLVMRMAKLVEARGDRIADRLVDRVLPPVGPDYPSPTQPKEDER